MSTETFVCKKCNREMPWTKATYDQASGMCKECAGERVAAMPNPAGSTSSGARAEPTAQPTEQGSASACILFGLVLLGVGAYFLLVSPSAGDSELFGRAVVNLQRLAIGQTAAVSGAIFLAAGLRPRP